MEYKDYYQTLGVAKSASQDDIKRSYRKLARKYHPDVSSESDAEEKFKEVGEAYEVLKNPEKRAAYDQLGANWKAGQAGSQPPPDWDAGFEFHGGDNASHHTDYSEFFENLFGQTGGGQQQYSYGNSAQSTHQIRGEDSHAKVFIDLEDAYNGATRHLTIRSMVLDKEGRPTLKERTLKVKIPKGVKQGQNIRLQRQGSPSFSNGQHGDLYLEIEFNPHSIYKVDGLDVSLVLPITPWEAALGGTIQVPTPVSKVELKVSAGSSSGKRMRLKGLGIPNNKMAGDFYVTLEIVLPEQLTDKEKTLYKDLQQQAADFNPRIKLGV
ncbi:MAG: DnaJ domain-containing protein [Methylophaga sp.]|nr:DnaJ domain-containing protein [Methylophaga sp.]